MNLVTKNLSVFECVIFQKKETIVLSFTILDSAFGEKQKTIIRVAQEAKTIHRNAELKKKSQACIFLLLTRA
jgi:hypothetical protein